MKEAKSSTAAYTLQQDFGQSAEACQDLALQRDGHIKRKKKTGERAFLAPQGSRSGSSRASPETPELEGPEGRARVWEADAQCASTYTQSGVHSWDGELRLLNTRTPVPASGGD